VSGVVVVGMGKTKDMVVVVVVGGGGGWQLEKNFVGRLPRIWGSILFSVQIFNVFQSFTLLQIFKPLQNLHVFRSSDLQLLHPIFRAASDLTSMSFSSSRCFRSSQALTQIVTPLQIVESSDLHTPSDTWARGGLQVDDATNVLSS